MDLSRLHQLRITRPHPVGNIPLAVLTALQFDVVQAPGMTVEQAREDHLRLQNDLAKLSTNSEQIMVSGSGHEIYLYKPNVVVSCVAAVVSSAKNHSPLTPCSDGDHAIVGSRDDGALLNPATALPSGAKP